MADSKDPMVAREVSVREFVDTSKEPVSVANKVTTGGKVQVPAKKKAK